MQSFQSAFELSGDVREGVLRLLSPIGTVLGTLNWSPTGAQLQTPTQTQPYDSLDDLMLATTGARVPVAALFDWLDGRPTAVDGWSVDLSRWVDGRYRARQLDAGGEELTELLIVLDR